MRQERRDLLIEIFDNAAENKNYFYPITIYTHTMKKRKEDYGYLEAVNLIHIEETIDSGEWEISLTPNGIERAQGYKDKTEIKEETKTAEEDLFEEQLEELWLRVKSADNKQEQIGYIVALLAQTKGLTHIKGNAYVKIAEIVIGAYEEGLYGDIHEVVDDFSVVTKESGVAIGNALKGIARELKLNG